MHRSQSSFVLGDSKDSRKFFLIKTQEKERGIKQEGSFVDSLFMMFKLRKKIVKTQEETKAYLYVKQYTHKFGDFIFYKSIDFRSIYL